MFDKKKWYLKNRERILLEKRKDYCQNKKKYLERCHVSYLKRREKILTQKKIYDEELKRKLRESIGSKCVICGSLEKISFHEFHGRRHTRSRKYILEHYKDFIALCRGCHIGIHRFARKGKLDTELLVRLILHLTKEA